MAVYYWVGGSGTYDNSNTTNWSTLSGGSGGSGPPTNADDVHFDSLSNATAYTVTMGTSAVCKDFLVDAAPLTSGKMTWAGSTAFIVSGSFSTSTTFMTRTYTGALTFNSTSSGKTVTMGGITLASAVVFSGASGVWTLQDGFTTSSTITLSNGTLDTNGQAVSSSTFTSNAGTRVLTLGGTTWTLGAGATPWTVTASGMTLNANTSSLTMSPSGGSCTFAGGGLTYYAVTINSVNTSVTISGANSYTNMTITSNASSSPNFQFSANQTITGTFTATGNAPKFSPRVSSTTAGTQVTLTCAAVSLTDIAPRDIAGAGAAAPFTGTRISDGTGNSGITVTTAADKFYVGNSANWSGTVWSLTDGGAAGVNNHPLPQDTAKFTSNSFSANSQTVTFDSGMSPRLPNVDFSGMTNRTGITLATGTQAPFCFGSLTLTTATSFSVSGTGIMSLNGRNTQTITSNGVSWTQPFTIDSLGGTAKPADAWTGPTGANSLTLTNGSLDLNGKTVSFGRFSSSNTNTRTLLGTSGGTLKATDTTAATTFDATTTTNLTVTRSTWGIDIAGNTTNVRTINLGAAITWPAITFSNTTAAGGLDIVSSGTATVIKSLSYTGGTAQTIRRTAATTIDIDGANGFVSGTSGNVITLASITAASHTWTYSGGGTISQDYLSISRSTVTPALTWYAGGNSTDGGNNSGWIFTIPVGSIVGRRTLNSRVGSRST